jgi:hypothetical protein
MGGRELRKKGRKEYSTSKIFEFHQMKFVQLIEVKIIHISSQAQKDTDHMFSFICGS